MDQSEEQLDYGEEDHANVNASANANGAFRGGAPAEEYEEIPDDDDYDDLYQDVNVGFIEPHRHHLQNPQTSLPLLDPPPRLHISQPLPDVSPSLPRHAQAALPLSSSTLLPPEEESPRFRGADLGRRAGGESTSGHRGGGATATGSAAGTPTSTPRGDPDFSAARATESGSGGGSTVFVGDLHWWTTDAELEAALSEFGRVREITFFQERASGKSKGFCQVHFYDSTTARACKEGMNGRVFNGRACVVAYKSPRSVRHMSDANANANANAKDNKRISNDGVSARGPGVGGSYDGGRNYGRSGRGSHGQGQGRGLGQGRGRSGKGGGNSGGGHYGQGLLGPMGMQSHSQPQPSGLMAPMGNQGFDPSFGRGASGWPSFPGMVAQYPPVGSMGIPLAGVAPHVNPAFFNRGLAGNGMGMMPSANTNSPGMDQTMWPDWASEVVSRRGADSSHGDDAYGYGYGDDRGGGGRSNASRARDSEWIANTPEKRHRSDKDVDWERERYRDKERNLYRDQRNNWDKDDDYERERDRERVAARPRSKSRALEEDDPHSHPRPLSEYGKRRR